VGPVSVDLQAVDWDDEAVHADVLAGRFQAWSPCLRGLEGLAAEVFDVDAQLGGFSRADAFAHEVGARGSRWFLVWCGDGRGHGASGDSWSSINGCGRCSFSIIRACGTRSSKSPRLDFAARHDRLTGYVRASMTSGSQPWTLTTGALKPPGTPLRC
jgi:hypothetical protein